MSDNVAKPPVSLEMFQNSTKTFTLTIVDASGSPVDLTGKTLRLVVHDDNNPAVGAFQVDSPFVVGGVGNNTVTFTVSKTSSVNAGAQFLWELWNLTDDDVLHHGSLVIRPALQTAP